MPTNPTAPRRPARPVPPAAALLAALALAACAGAPATRTTAGPGATPAAPAAAAGSARARADSARYPYTAADVRFMTAMIGHHAQAVAVARWAPTHGAGPAVRRLAERIVNGQADEIGTMQRWLRDRRQPVPDPSSAMGAAAMHHAGGAAPAAGHGAAGQGAAEHGAHHAQMPGMLTAAQLAGLDRARGEEFDRLFLTHMIQHHRGAVSMVEALFATPAAGQDETVFKFAADVNVDQTTEIARMQKMLAELTFGGGAR